jgi:hypothetical protein
VSLILGMYYDFYKERIFIKRERERERERERMCRVIIIITRIITHMVPPGHHYQNCELPIN